MKAKSMMLAMAAGGVCTAGALAAEPNLTNDFNAGRVAGHIYVNAATGEVVRTPSASRLTDLYWENDDIAGSCNFFTGVDRPTRDTTAGRVKFGASVVTWGDMPCALTDGYDAAYASNVGADTAGSGITGLNMINIFIDDYDGDLDPGGTGAFAIAGYILGDIAGGDATLGTSLFQGWIYTVDLEGGFEFSWGDASGSCPDDLDGDGLHDGAYAYTFEQTQSDPKGIIGPFLVRPASLGGLGTATGCVDRYDWFNDSDTAQTGPYGTELYGYVGAFFFGGGACPTTPYAVFLMNLYGQVSGGGCAQIDYNGDGLIDFSDYLEFLNRYDSQDPSADLNGDGLVDFSDYLVFLNLYDACSA